MGRARRPTHAGLFHVTSRSVAEERIFGTTEDCVDGLNLLASLAREGLMVCHACCLMPTHYHLVASFGEGRLSRAVQLFNRRYASGFNARHGRRGHVFDSPYRAIEVTTERHLLVLPAYLAHNPHDLDWPWSSYPGTIGTRAPFSFVDPTPLIDAFGSIDRLQRFVETWAPTSRDVELLRGRQSVPGTSGQHAS